MIGVSNGRNKICTLFWKGIFHFSNREMDEKAKLKYTLEINSL